MTSLLEEPRATPQGIYTPPDGRNWRVAVCWRGPGAQRGVGVTELADAHARKVHVDLYGSGTADCVIDGRSPQLASVQELAQDLVLYRWNPYKNYPASGGYECYFRGPIGRTEDTLSETTHTVNISASDYRAFLHDRCPLLQNFSWTGMDQATMVRNLIGPYNWGGMVPYDQGFDLSQIGSTGVLRDRAYTYGSMAGALIDDLSQVINGFDWVIEPLDPAVYGGPGAYYATCQVFVWYPQMGTTKSFVAEYGVTVPALTRTVNSADFANYVQAIGRLNPANNLPIVATAAGDVVTNPELYPEGLWPSVVSAADVSDQNTITQTAQGHLAIASVLQPSYTLSLRQGAWVQRSDCWLGDTITLRIRSGRLNVNTQIRILAIDFDIDDAGAETVSLTVGRPKKTLGTVLAATDKRLDTLSRR